VTAESASATIRRWTAIVIVADLLKHLALLSLGLAQPWGDSAPYWQLARDAALGDIWLTLSQQAYRTPGYPWFLAGFVATFGEYALVAAVLTQHLAVLATSAMTAALATRVTRSPALGLVAWALCALSTARPLFANWLLTESIATALLTAAIWQLVGAADQCSPRRLMAGSVLLGIGVLVRPSLLAAAPAAWLAGWFTGSNPRQRFVHSLIAPALMGLCLVPWGFRNLVQFDRFALTVFTGRELWTAHFSPWPGGELTIPTDGAGAELRLRLNDAAIDLRHNWSVSNVLRQSGLNDAETDSLMARVAWQAICSDPGRAAFRTVARFATFWYVRDWEIDLIHDGMSADSPNLAPDQRRWMTSPLQNTVVTGLQFTPERWFPAMWAWSAFTWLGIGLLVIRPDRRRVGLLIATVLVTTTVLTAALEIPLYRYRCMLEPLMIVATVGLVPVPVVRK
jgi:hypothetical protein